MSFTEKIKNFGNENTYLEFIEYLSKSHRKEKLYQYIRFIFISDQYAKESFIFAWVQNKEDTASEKPRIKRAQKVETKIRDHVKKTLNSRN